MLPYSNIDLSRKLVGRRKTRIYRNVPQCINILKIYTKRNYTSKTALGIPHFECTIFKLFPRLFHPPTGFYYQNWFYCVSVMYLKFKGLNLILWYGCYHVDLCKHFLELVLWVVWRAPQSVRFSNFSR